MVGQEPDNTLKHDSGLDQTDEQSRLATAVENAAESIIVTDPAGIIEYVNPAFEKITGYL